MNAIVNPLTLRDPLDAELPDAPPLEAAEDHVIAAVEAAEAPADEESKLDKKFPHSLFSVTQHGVFYTGVDDEPQWICSRLDVAGLTRDAESANWGRVLEFPDADGKLHVWSMPMEMLRGGGEDLRGELLRLGLEIAPGTKARNRLAEYITTAKPNARARCVTRTGWCDDAFVFPDRTLGETPERILYQSDHSAKVYTRAGTLDDWRRTVAAKCVGNSRLVLVVSIAFAAPLLHRIGSESGGFNLVDESSTGKTTGLRVAASAYGPPEYINRWRATLNGLEGIAALHNDMLLVLDELGQVDAQEVGESVYLLANGSGKQRAGKMGAARARQQWRLAFLSAGEIGLAQHMRTAGKKAKAGQEVRMVDIPANAGAGFGLFENLHGHESGGAFSKALQDATARSYGTAAPAFIENLTLPENLKTLPDILKTLCAQFVAENLPVDANGQAHRVCERFGLVAVAGELATRYGITGWPVGEAERAASACVKAWIDGRGGAGNQERATTLAQVRAFFELHGESRFTAWDSDDRPTINRAGFKRMDGTVNRFYVLTEAFKNEVCAGLDSRAVARLCVEAGWIEPDKDGAAYRRESLPGLGRTRCYVFTSAMWED